MGFRKRGAGGGRTRLRTLALAVPVSLLALAFLPAITADASATPSLTATPASTAASPIVISPGSVQTATFSNASGSRSTGALQVIFVTSPSGSDLSISSDSCTHSALGPGRSCQVSVAYGPTAPAHVQTASLTVQGRAPGSSSLSVYFWVRPAVDQPIANMDIYHVTVGNTLTVTEPGPLANDSDPDGDPIRMVVTNGPLYGDLTFSSDGSFSYRSDSEPPGDGIDSF